MHTGFTAALARRLLAGRGCGAGDGRLHRMVSARALLGDAFAKGDRPDSSDRVDSAGYGAFAESKTHANWSRRAVSMVSSDDADDVGHCKHPRLLSRCGAHARR